MAVSVRHRRVYQDDTPGERYVVVGCTPWAQRAFVRTIRHLPGRWLFLNYRQQLTPEALALYFSPKTRPGPHRVFFLHWRWMVPAAITSTYECIGFHLGSLPTERGGTPLQWRVVAGKKLASLSMYRMTDEVDAGPVYRIGAVCLDGAAEAIYHRMMDEAARLLAEWLERPTYPAEQEGAPVVYPRRTPDLSALEGGLTLDGVYDRIRMVDAPGYPNAHLEHGGQRYTFRRAVSYGDRIEADVTITTAEAEGEAG